MKKSILFFCLLICACWTARSQQKESPENLIKQKSIEDYKQYVGSYLTAMEDATLYAAEPQIIEILEPFDFKSKYKKRSRTFTFNKIRTHLYKAIVKEIDVLTKDKDKQLTTINTPLLKCKTAGCKFEIIDVIRWDEFRQIVNPFIEKSQQEELALKKEIWNLKVPKKLRIQDAEPKIYPSSWMGFPYFLSNDYPVFVLQDDEDNICYWVSPLKTTSYTTDELVFEPYLNYLKKHYINVKYFDKAGKKYQINELYADPDSHAICVCFATSSKMRLETLKSRIASKELMLLDDYKTYAAEQERLRQIAEEKARIRQQEALRKKQQETLRKQEEERQKVLAEQRKKQMLVQKYGAHYANCIMQKRLEVGMPKNIVMQIMPVLFDDEVYACSSYVQGRDTYERRTINSNQFWKHMPEDMRAGLYLLIQLSGGLEQCIDQYLRHESMPRTLLFRNGILIEFNN